MIFQRRIKNMCVTKQVIFSFFFIFNENSSYDELWGVFYSRETTTVVPSSIEMRYQIVELVYSS